MTKQCVATTPREVLDAVREVVAGYDEDRAWSRAVSMFRYDLNGVLLARGLRPMSDMRGRLIWVQDVRPLPVYL